MDILQNNLALLSKTNFVLAEKIRNHTDFTSEFTLDESLSGDPVLMKNNNFLNDNVDPEQEAINHLNMVENKGSAGFNFIYGLGLGYFLKRFNKSVEGYIIVFESDLDVLRLVFEMVDFTDELSNNKVFIFDNLNDVDKFYEKFFFYEYTISTSIADTYKTFDFDNAKAFIDHLGYIHGLYLSNYQTFWNKHHSWVNSLADNLAFIPKYNEVKFLKDKFKNKPAIVISAGPSLDKSIEFIAKNQDKFIIFCVGTALKSAVKYGIKPDFVCVVEYLPVTARMLDEVDLSDSNIILQPSTCNEIFKSNAKNKFIFYADNDEASKWVAKKFNICTTDYINRGTVSVNALVSAKIMGCNPIILVGQDLAYTDNKCYAAGSIYDNYVVKDKEVVINNPDELMKKTKNSEKSINSRAKSLTKQLYKVKGQNGEFLISPGDYASFIKYFEDIAKDYSKTTKLINSSPGGAQIDGYENMKFDKVLSEFAFKNIEKSVENITVSDFANNEIIKKEVTKTIGLFETRYKKIFDEALKIANNFDALLKKEDAKDKNQIYLDSLEYLIKFYKELRVVPTTDLFELFICRNTFFIDFYLKNIQENQHRLFLAKIMFTLFKTDYEKFILPLIKKLKELDL